jgi:hypothetical protein
MDFFQEFGLRIGVILGNSYDGVNADFAENLRNIVKTYLEAHESDVVLIPKAR